MAAKLRAGVMWVTTAPRHELLGSPGGGREAEGVGRSSIYSAAICSVRCLGDALRDAEALIGCGGRAARWGNSCRPGCCLLFSV